MARNGQWLRHHAVPAPVASYKWSIAYPDEAVWVETLDCRVGVEIAADNGSGLRAVNRARGLRARHHAGLRCRVVPAGAVPPIGPSVVVAAPAADSVDKGLVAVCAVTGINPNSSFPREDSTFRQR